MALLGLAIKCSAMYVTTKTTSNAPHNNHFIFLLFIIATLSQTLFETIHYLILDEAYQPYQKLIMDGYYISTTATLILLPFSISIIIGSRILPYTKTLAGLLFAATAFTIIATPFIIDGYQSLGYSLTRNPGPYYWMFPAIAITMALLSVTIAIVNYFKNRNEIIRVKCINLLIGFTPLVVIVSSILVLMQMGLTLNAAGVGSVLLSAFVLVMSMNLRKDRVLDLTIYLPWSFKARKIRELSRPLRIVSLSPNTCKDMAKEYDRTMAHVADMMFVKQRDAAAWLGVSDSKMSRLVPRRAKKG